MRLLLVDDHALVRAGLRRLLAGLAPGGILEAASGREAMALTRAERPDMVLLDLNLPGIGGLELLRRLLQEAPPPRVLILSMHTEPLYASRALELGAGGYISKNASPDELMTAVRRVGAGGRYIEAEIAQEMALQAVPAASNPLRSLTGRDLEILRLLAEGRSLGEIAEAIGIGYKTVANTCSRLKARLGAARTVDLVRIAVDAGVS